MPQLSALVVAVPEAEPVVGSWRAALDASAGWGVPAHVTVLYPFLPPERLDAGVRAAVRAEVAAVPPVTFTVRAVHLPTGPAGAAPWRTDAVYPLGGSG